MQSNAFLRCDCRQPSRSCILGCRGTADVFVLELRLFLDSVVARGPHLHEVVPVVCVIATLVKQDIAIGMRVVVRVVIARIIERRFLGPKRGFVRSPDPSNA